MPDVVRRSSPKAIAGSLASCMLPKAAVAQDTRTSFEQWIGAFRTKAVAPGVTEGTHIRVMCGLHPDTTGLDAIRNQADFDLQLW